MNCQTCIDFLQDYLNGDLSLCERRTFDEHLLECPECADYMQMYRETVASGKRACCEKDLAVVEIPEELVRAILAAKQHCSERHHGTNS